MSEAVISSNSCFKRFSNSPFIEAPACSSPKSKDKRRLPLRASGTSSRAKRSAKPSTTAVLPTPASPVSIGLFCRRRSKISIRRRISRSRPTISSISPALARAVRSTQYRAKASPLPIAAGDIKAAGCPVAALSPPEPVPLLAYEAVVEEEITRARSALRWASAQSFTISGNCCCRRSALILRNSRLMPCSTKANES